MRQRVQLPCVARDARTHQRIRWEGHRLHLPIGRHVERVGPGQKVGMMHGEGEPRKAWGRLHTLTLKGGEVPPPCLVPLCV